jgi:hypothetical protein
LLYCCYHDYDHHHCYYFHDYYYHYYYQYYYYDYHYHYHCTHHYYYYDNHYLYRFLLNYLSTKIKIKTDTWKGINCISSSLNEVSINLIGLIKSFREEDFINSEGLYFINSNVYTITILKLLELKLLNYFNKEYFNIIIEQNNILSNNYKKNLSKLNSCVYVGLTNLNLFEDFGLYQTSDGDFKTTIKIIPVANNYSKSNWHILRRLFLHIDKNLFLEKKITLPFKNYLTFLNYINYI